MAAILKPDPAFVAKLKRLSSCLNAHFDSDFDRWVITEDVHSVLVEYVGEPYGVIRTVRWVPNHVMKVETPMKQYKPLDERTIVELAMACDIQKLFHRGADAVDKLVERKRELREYVAEQAREERLYWWKHERRQVIQARDNYYSGILNDPPTVFEPQIYNLPTHVEVPKSCFSGTQPRPNSDPATTGDATPCLQAAV